MGENVSIYHGFLTSAICFNQASVHFFSSSYFMQKIAFTNQLLLKNDIQMSDIMHHVFRLGVTILYRVSQVGKVLIQNFD